MKPADYAWIVLAAAIVGYEIAAATRRDWELLSEAADRYRAGRPVASGTIGDFSVANPHRAAQEVDAEQARQLAGLERNQLVGRQTLRNLRRGQGADLVGVEGVELVGAQRAQ